MSIRKFFTLVIAGTMLGAVFAMAAPPTAVNASSAPQYEGNDCVCNEYNSTGQYQCDANEGACVAGTQGCHLLCF